LAVFLALASFVLFATLLVIALLSSLGRSTLGKRNSLTPAFIPLEVDASSDRRRRQIRRRATLKRTLGRSPSAE
jgi:hypothetical protein